MRIVLIWVRDEGEGPTTVKDRRLGTDRRRSRQRTVVVSDVSYATVYLVRHALAGIERATCSRPTGLLCGRLLVALVESVLRPGGWESMCRLMCHCVRHISLDNKYGRSVKAILVTITLDGLHRALCRHASGRPPYGKKSSMGSENLQRCSRRFRKSAMMRSVPPRFDCVGRGTR